MVRFFVFALLSLAVLAGAWKTKKRLELSDYAYPAPTAAFGIILIFRTMVSKFDPHPGYFLVRSWSAGEETFLWLVFILLVAAFLVRQLFFDKLPSALQSSPYKEVVRWFGLTFFFWALVVPLNWLSPVGKAMLLLLALIVAVVLLARAARGGGKALWLVGGLAAVFFLVSFLFTPASFWQQSVPRDFGEKTCQLPLFQNADRCKTESLRAAEGQAKGGTVNPQSIAFTTDLGKNPIKITATCSSSDACMTARRQINVYGQSVANHAGKHVTVVMVSGKKTLGQSAFRPVSTKSDQEYGAVANDTCVAPDGSEGTELPDPKSGKLACRPKAGHEGPHF